MTERRVNKIPDDPVLLLPRGQSPAGQGFAEVGERAPVDVRALLNGTREAILMLDGEPYRLRITAKDKLILTK
jgi:hemin uptake protein HemP